MYDQVQNAITLTSVILIPIIYWILRRYGFGLRTQKQVVLFFAIWSAVFLLEYFIFGANSYVSVETDGRNLVFLKYLSERVTDSIFSHEFAGGQDLAVMLPGTQYLSPERLLLGVASPWIVLLLHKLFIASLGFWGIYLLACQFSGVKRLDAVSVSSIYPLCHLYLTDYSLEFGAGFAALPIGVYACLFFNDLRRNYWRLLGIALVLSTAIPLKIYPAFFVATVGCMILFKGVNFQKTCFAFAICILFSVFNWHEVLYAFSQVSEFTSRGLSYNRHDLGIVSALITLPSFFLVNPTLLLLCAVSIAVLILARDKFVYRVIGALLWYAISIFMALSMPWEMLGLGLVNKITHGYMALSFPVLVLLIIARMLVCIRATEFWPSGIKFDVFPSIAVLSIALALLCGNRIQTGVFFLAFGGQSQIHGYEELINSNWKGKKNFRFVTLFDVPHPNVISGFYNLDTFDGTALVNRIAWNQYWYHIKKRDQAEQRIATRPEVDWRYWNSKTYDVSEHLNLDLLRVANVRYLLSALPLTGSGLSALFKPLPRDWPKNRRDMFSGLTEYLAYRWRRIFDPGKHFVYELTNALPRVYAARGVYLIDDKPDPQVLHKIIARHALAKDLVVERRYAPLIPAMHKLRVLKFMKTASGYDIDVEAGSGGLLVFNNTHGPFWTARAGDMPLQLFPANAIHTAIVVPPGIRKVVVQYARQGLKDKLM